MASQIPDLVRQQVRLRDRHRCVRCSAAGTEVHHRRSKSITDDHTHCPCNLILVCGWGNHKGCHGFAHSNPLLARIDGLIVSRHSPEPHLQPVVTLIHGPVLLTCEGGYEPYEEEAS